MCIPGSASTGRPPAHTLCGSGTARFYFRKLAAMAGGPAVSQAKPLPKGSRKATGLSPSKSTGPRPISLCARPRMSPAAPVSAASSDAPATPQPSQALLVTPECTCSPGTHTARNQPVQPTGLAVVQPTMRPEPSLRRSPWRPLIRIGWQGSARRVRTSSSGCLKHSNCWRAWHL